MWIFTKYGFFSAVCARAGDGRYGQPVDPTRIMVRARRIDHLESLKHRFESKLGSAEIVSNVGTDYAYRLFVPKSVWVQILSELGEETDYGNFKSAVEREQGSEGTEYAKALHRVWSEMNKLQH